MLPAASVGNLSNSGEAGGKGQMDGENKVYNYKYKCSFISILLMILYFFYITSIFTRAFL